MTTGFEVHGSQGSLIATNCVTQQPKCEVRLATRGARLCWRRRSPVAVQIVKTMVNFAEGEDPEAPIEGLAGGLTATTGDLAEGVASFREKRALLFMGIIPLTQVAFDRL